MTVLSHAIAALECFEPREVSGTVGAVRGLSVLVNDLSLPIGSLVRIQPGSTRQNTSQVQHGEIVGFDGARSIVMLLNSDDGIKSGDIVIGERTRKTIEVGDSLLGRVVDGLGRPIDRGGRLFATLERSIDAAPTSALQRRRIIDPLPTGVRAIDAMLTLGKGQRVGIFSSAGVGKSTLLGLIARNTTADVNVIALIGERGREVREFMENALGPSGLKRSIVVVATSDESPLMRVRAAMAACTIAEYFRDAGKDVLLIMDSITRFAQAQRQIGLTVGEQPATKGYTPSVFALMPMLLERAGAIEGVGSITGLYAVLVEADDMNEPIADAARGVLDGHIVLSRKLAARGHYPAIDVLNSISRVADEVCDRHHVEARRQLIRVMAAHAEAEELINIGAYSNGSNPLCDVAIAMKGKLEEFLRQSTQEQSQYPQTCRTLLELAGGAQHMLHQVQTQRSSAARGLPRQPN